jgi:hypothetical protein
LTVLVTLTVSVTVPFAKLNSRWIKIFTAKTCLHTRDLVYERLGPGVLQTLEKKSPRNERGYRPNKLHQWLTEDIGDPMLAQHLHALMMFQRLAIANGYGWNRFVQMVDQVLPKRGTTLDLPFPVDDAIEPAPSS